MKRNRPSFPGVLLLVPSLLLLNTNVATAAPIRIDFSGEVVLLSPTFVDSPTAIGTTFSGYAVYDDETAASFQNATFSSHLGAVSEISVTWDGLGTVFWNESLVSNPFVQSPSASVSTSGIQNFLLGASNNSQTLQAFDGEPSLLTVTPSVVGALSDWVATGSNLQLRGGPSILSPGELPDDTLDTSGDPVDIFVFTYTLWTASGTFTGQITGRLDEVIVSSNATSTVPEPATLLLLGTGLLGAGVYRRRRKQ